MKSFLDDPGLQERNMMLENIFRVISHLPHQRQLEILAAWIPKDSLKACYELNVVEKGLARPLEYKLTYRMSFGRSIRLDKTFTTPANRFNWLDRMGGIYGRKFSWKLPEEEKWHSGKR